ncbi:DUF4190 domain-containing protein [Bifidobacterium ramosum]|nr:DUF4190 domain-containing protein [Bifidobacterium ramosum]
MPGQPYPQGPYYPYGAYPMPANERWNVMCIVGFVLSFVFAPVGLVLSIVALIQINKSGEKSKGMSIAGIIIGAVNTLMLLVAIVALVAFMGAAAGYMERNGAYFGDDSTPADCAFEVNGQCYGFDDLDDYAEDYYRLNGELPGDLSGWLDAADGNVDYSTVIDVR